ncbi:MAG: type II secretion system inner membrane protein GspF [Burkholderiaceae bacterium]
MTAFRYEAAEESGRIRTGVVDADSPRLARAGLRQQGLTPLSVEALSASNDARIDEAGSDRKPGDASEGRSQAFRRRMPTTERALLVRQLASLVTAGLPLAQALAVVQDQAEKPRVRDLLAAIRGDVVSGMTLASAFARHPRDIPELDRALIAAGEQSGDLGTVLMRLADHIERRNALKAKVTAAFVYPAIVTGVAILVVTALLVYVVPQIVGVFAQTKQKLPFLTLALIGLSNFIRAYGWLVAIGVAVAAFITRRTLKRPGPKRAWHARLLTLPLAGPLVRRADLARFSDTLAILVGAGVPILRALLAARDTMSNVVLRDTVDEAIVRVREGASLSRALRPPRGERGEFPPVLLNLIASGEATGKLPDMLERAATSQADELERRTLWLTSLLEPLLVLAMGAMVLLIVLAILMPIIDMNQLIH